MFAIAINQLHFGYRDGAWHPRGTVVEILRGIDLHIGVGEVFVLLGPNGAGKTTLLRVLLGFVRPTTGEAKLFDLPVHLPAARARVGYLPEQPVLYPHLDARGFLHHFAELARLPHDLIGPRIDTLLERTGIAAHGPKPMSSYSKGMLQRLNLCRALLTDPDLIIMDEPIIGLDPLGQQLVRELVLEARVRGKTVFINTHAAPFAREVADRVGLMMGGRLTTTLTRTDWTRPQPPYLATLEGPGLSGDAVGGFGDCLAHNEVATTLRLADEAARDRLLAALGQRQWRLVNLHAETDPLEAIFHQHAAPLSAEERAR